MTKQEVIVEMKRGSKVTHKSFMSDEWIMMVDGDIVTEDGYSIDFDMFWRDRHSEYFNDGWEIFVN